MSFCSALDDNIQHVFLSFRGEALYFIYMGPEYLPNAENIPHLRYAPYPMLILTWQRDVEAAKLASHAIFTQIRTRMVAAMGGLYDASERVLAQRPKVHQDED